MKQYGIYIQCNGGTPYMIHFYNDIESAKLKLYDIISVEEERGRPYFVDNDFFDNKYKYVTNKLKYFQIRERNVSEWNIYSEEQQQIMSLDNVLFFSDYNKNLKNSK